MVSRFTNIILTMLKLQFTKEDIDKVIDLEIRCSKELEWASENIKGSNAREDESVAILDYYNELEDEIFTKYI